MFDNMINPAAMMNNLFRKVDNAVWDLQTGRLGFVGKDGIHTLSGEGEDASVELNIISQFGMPIPAFARSMPLAAVKIGDMVSSGSIKGWVVGITSNADGVVTKFKIMQLTGVITSWKPPQIKMLGFDSGVMVVTSLLNLAPGGSAGMANLQSSLLPLMMMGGGNGNGFDMESILPMLLMSGGFGTATDASATSGLGGMMQSFMMMSMMQKMMGGGNGGGNNTKQSGTMGGFGNGGFGNSPFNGRRGGND